MMATMSLAGCFGGDDGGSDEEVDDSEQIQEEILFEGDDIGECSDGADNDRDGMFDCDDPNCAGAPICKLDENQNNQTDNNTDEEVRNYTVPTIWEVADLNNTTLTDGAIDNAKCGLIFAWPAWDGAALANIETLRNSISENREGEIIHVWSAIYEDSNQEVIIANIHNFLFEDDKTTNHLTPYKILVENGSMIRLVDYSYNNQTGCEGEANIGLNSILQLDEPTPTCGDAIIEAGLGESCDDGNTADGDGCSSTCQIEPQPCGDGVIDENEQCDDGNTADGDGCSSTCEQEDPCANTVCEPGWTCDGDGNCIPPQDGTPCDDGDPTTVSDAYQSGSCVGQPKDCGDRVVNSQTGECECPQGLTDCNGDCVDCETDDNNCGACGNVCGEGWTCDDGDCIPQYFQPETRDELKTAVDEWIANSTEANSTYGNISTWDTSLITDMSELFYYNETFNDDISQWDVSSVTTTEKMFKFAQSFNQDLSGWDVSNVVYMNEMFYYATNFNQDIGYWDVSSVTDMEGMFFAATDFNQDLVSWDVSKVTDTNGMFFSATSFNGDISHWDTSNVTKLNSMFRGASSFNQDISGWDVSGVNDWYGMNSMFYGAESFNQDISSWDVSNVNNMYAMFYDAKSFNQDLSNWDVSGSTNLNAMFDGADDLSDENKCVIHNSFSLSDYWNYDWAEYCSDD